MKGERSVMADLLHHCIHQAAGAVFSQVAAWQAPESYGDPAGEYRAVREAVGITDRSARGKIRMTGSERVRFLNSMVSKKIEGLERGMGVYATVTDAQGHTLTDLWVHNRGEAFLLETEPGLQEKLYASLDRFLIADDVEMEDVTDAWAIVGVQGPKARELVSETIGAIATDLPEHHSIAVPFNGTEVVVVARTCTGEPGFDLWVTPERAGALWRVLAEAGGRPVGFSALEALRIEAGIARYGMDINEQVVPIEAGLYHAVDFDKGCYVGQEVIAKMHYRGKPRRYLVGLQIEGDTPPVPGTSIHAGEKEIGRITSSVRSPALDRVIALASVRRGFEQPGEKVLLEEGVRAEVVDLPFYRKKKNI